jgi:hypothetical protein
MNQRKVCIEFISKGGYPLGSTSIRGDDHAVLELRHVLSDPEFDTWLSVEIVDRQIEKSL